MHLHESLFIVVQVLLSYYHIPRQRQRYIELIPLLCRLTKQAFVSINKQSIDSTAVTASFMV